MNGVDVAVKHMVAHAIHQERVAHAESWRTAALAMAERPRMRRPGFAEARAAIVTALLRAGSWLKPDTALDARVRCLLAGGFINGT